MPATDRYATELLHHDEQAAERAAYFANHPHALLVDAEAYLDHETWIRFAFEQLGELRGRRVLDYGCGHGMASVILAQRGARVTAFDLSPGYVAEARGRVNANSLENSVDFVQASGERLPFADSHFDAIWGNAILHHLNLGVAASELARVLKPGGVAVFCEPLGENPVLEWARRRVPYPGKCRSPDERPMRHADLTLLGTHFHAVDWRPFQLLGMVRRVWPRTPLLRTLDRCDQVLLRDWPILGSYCRYLVLCLRDPVRV